MKNSSDRKIKWFTQLCDIHKGKSGALHQCFGETEKEGKREKEKRGKRKFENFLFLKVVFDFLFFCLKDKLKLIDF